MRRLAISDPHFVDIDLKRPDRHGVRGIDLLWTFACWLTHQGIKTQLFVLGDFLNFLRVMDKDLKTAAPILNLLVHSDLIELVIIAGNHDPLEGVEFLRYLDGKIHGEIVTTSKDGRPTGKSLVLMTHGDIFDPFWKPENREGGKAKIRLALGQEIIKRGHQAELIHPMIEDILMGNLERLFLKKGDRLPHQDFIDQAADLALEMGSREILTGHLHDLFDLVWKGVRIINLCSWVPSHKKTALLEKNEVLPGVYNLDGGSLHVWTHRGLESLERRVQIPFSLKHHPSPIPA